MSETKKSKGWLGSIASVFVEDDAPNKPTGSSVDAGDLNEGDDDDAIVAVAARPVRPSAQRKAIATADPKIVSRLEEALSAVDASALQTVFDTFESLAEDVPSEEARMRAAVRVAAKQGIDAKAINADFDKLDSVLHQKTEEFDRAVSLQTSEAVTARSERLHGLSTAIEEAHKQIEELQAHIAESVAESETIRAEIAESQGKIELAKANFAASMSAVASKLASKRALASKVLGQSGTSNGGK